VNSGSSQSFTITPDASYHVNDVVVDGSSVGAVTSYTFSNVTENHTISANFEIDTPDPSPYSEEGLEADFDVDEDGFSYAPDTFKNTAKPNFSSGSYEKTGGDGFLRVFLGPGSTGGATSGGWSRDFYVGQDGMAQVTLSYRLRMGQGYETNEFGEVILEVDGVRYGDDVNNSLVHIAGNGNGGSIDDSGWLT
jgi:hypothetical protein